MKYCIDTSALLGLGERHYPERIKVFAPIWEHLYEGIEQGTIVSVDYVKIEFEKKADEWRQDFLLKADGMFLISEGIEAEYAGVIASIEADSAFNYNKHRDRFMSGADPWVLALSRNIGKCTVVSAEDKNLSSYGMGAICNHFGMKHMNLLQFFEANKIGL